MRTDVQIVHDYAATLTIPQALALHDELAQMGLAKVLVNKRKNDLAALGVLAGYRFKGYGCGSCLAQIERGLKSGTLKSALQKLEHNPLILSDMKAELKKYELLPLAKKVRSFTFRDKDGKTTHKAPFAMTDEDVALFEAQKPPHKGRYFKVLPAKKKTPKPAKTDAK